jgi:hypothetical protein
MGSNPVGRAILLDEIRTYPIGPLTADLGVAEKLAELVGATLGGWSEERDTPLALSLVNPWA